MKKTLYHKISRGIKGISERYGLIIFITALLCSTTLPAKAAEEKGGELNVYEMVFGHIEDAYEWHITDIGETSLRIPLPIIVHDERGWHTFMSSRVENGATYDGFYISKEGTNSGKIVTRDNNGNEIRSVDISITKNVLALLINSAVLLIIMLKCASWYKKREVDKSVPRGGVGAIEALTVMIYDDVIKSGVGENYKKFAPYLLTAFFFILTNNLMGLIPFFPGGANVTGNIAVTMVLAICTFLLTNIYGSREYWKDIFWPDVPSWLKVPVPLMPFIEFIGVFTKPFALMIRLFANIMAGHAAILSLVAIIFITVKSGAIINGSMSFLAIIFGIFMDALEILVAFIQAYVFTMLSSVFIGLAQAKPATEKKK